MILDVGSQQKSQQHRSKTSSALLKTFGCVEKSNVTVLMGQDYIVNKVLIKSLEDPCHTIFYFAFDERRCCTGDKVVKMNQRLL